MALSAREKKGEDGFALVIVIWMTGLFALLSVGFIRTVQSFVHETAGTAEGARAEALADAGVNLAVIDLIAARKNPKYTRRFSIDATPVGCAVSSTEQISIRVQDSGGRVNINTAGPRLLQALFLGLGADLVAASRYTDTIIDYRDPDSDRRPAGAEKVDYLAAGITTGPKNTPLDALEELHQILGLDAGIIAAMEPHVTLHSGMAGVDPKAVSPELADILARGQQQLPSTDQQRSPAGNLPGEFAMSAPRRVFIVLSEGHMAGGAVFVREAVVDFSTTQNVYRVFKAWRRGKKAIASFVDDDLPPC